MKKFIITLMAAATLQGLSLKANPRTEYLLDTGWKFIKSDNPQYRLPNYNDSKWQTVTVPHDWAIYGPFAADNDLQKMAITQDGQTNALEHAGRTGGLPFVGVGWYRLEINPPAYKSGNRATLVFDGAMSHPEIFINGEKAGEWAYGYNSFFLDVTHLLKPNQTNLLAVRLENKAESSRWYPGAGLYRNVHLIITQDAHIPTWGTQLTTPVVSDKFAHIHLRTQLQRPSSSQPSQYKLVTKISDPQNTIVSTSTQQLTEFDNNTFSQTLVVQNPQLWNTNTPHLYRATSQLFEGNTLKDEYTTTFGIRSIAVKPDSGFFLNGEKVIFQGVCLHHDLGPLGAAVNEAAIRRQIRMLKDMGANAIRTSHNMPAPEVVKICDEMGMMVMVESFDEWKTPKMKNGYHTLFDQWAEKDLTNMLRQFRNNPSVVMWCIGNEVPDQHANGQGAKLSLWLQNICKREDPTRPVTQGMDMPDAVINNNFAAVMDVPGFNYRPQKYPEAYQKLPQRIILGSETASTVSSRGVYKFPLEYGAMRKYPDHQSSSYDVEFCSWSNLPEDDFITQEDLPYCMGEFVWTGFDYLGEPTPYYTDWPSHSSLFGIIDLAGIPKDRFYLYRSHWNKQEETLHILPHWSWSGREGETTPIFVYTNYPAAELFINGKSQGIRKKNLDITVHNTETRDPKRQERYRLMWHDTKYEPGTVKVVAYHEDGSIASQKEIHTAGKPHRIELVADRQTISADGKDLSFITVQITDKDGNLCPNAQDLISFKVTGAGTYRAGANGNSTSLDLFHQPRMHLFNGMLTAIVQATEQPGTITLEATAKGLPKAIIHIQTTKKEQ